MEFVDKENDFAVRVDDLLDDRFEPVLEFASVFGSGDQGSHIERDDAAVLEDLGDVARSDALGETLCNGGLANPGFADQHRVVLGAPGEHLHDTSNLVVAANDRIELAGVGELGQIAAIVIEGVILVLRIGVSHAVRSTQLLNCGQ